MGPIVVSGFGRCGSSLVMQMLAAGGVPCLGKYPSFESRATVQPGQAVKVLDPQRATPIPYAIPVGARVIWLDRDTTQQAESIAKFTRLMMGLDYNRKQRRELAVQLRIDRIGAMRAIGSRPMLELWFSRVLVNPRAAAQELAEFVGSSTFDVDAAARQVRPRSPECAPGLDMELGLMRLDHWSPA